MKTVAEIQRELRAAYKKVSFLQTYLADEMETGDRLDENLLQAEVGEIAEILSALLSSLSVSDADRP